MDKIIIKFHDTEIEEYKFHQQKCPISINNIDIDKIVVPNNFRYFLGYKNDKEIRPLCIFSLEISIYKIYSDKTECVYFMITFWEKVSNIIK